MVLKYLTLEEFEKQDLCFRSWKNGKLYDFNNLQLFFDTLTEDVTPQMYRQWSDTCIELSRRLAYVEVYRKIFFEISDYTIVKLLQNEFNIQFEALDGEYPLQVSDKAKDLLDDAIKQIQEDNPVYRTLNYAEGYINLSLMAQKYWKQQEEAASEQYISSLD